MLNFGTSKPRVKGGPGPPGAPQDPRLVGHRRFNYHQCPNLNLSQLYESEANTGADLGAGANPRGGGANI